MAPMRRTRGGLERDVLAVLATGQLGWTPGQVRTALEPDLAYTTVMTVLARLHTKGLVTRQRTGRAYAYTAVRDPDERTALRMQHLLADGTDRGGVLARFVDTLAPADERLLRDLLTATDPGAEGQP